MAKIHQGGLPVVWDDTMSPAFGQGTGSAAPTVTNFVGSGDDVVRLLAFAPATQDRLYNTTQIAHDLLIPSTGTNVTFKPHVHFTFIAEPSTGTKVVWEWTYVYAKSGIDSTTAGEFSSAVTMADSTYLTSDAGAEIRKHLLTSLDDVVVPSSKCGASMIFCGTLKLSSRSTVGANEVAALSFDLHYQKGPIGTIGEFA